MAANATNLVMVTGRLARDPKQFTNKDGSRKVLFTVVANQNFKNRNGERGTDAIQFQAFLSKDIKNKTVYDYINQGTLVSVQGTIRTNNYEKDGEMVYDTQILSENVQILMNPKNKQEESTEDVEVEEVEIVDGDMPF